MHFPVFVGSPCERTKLAEYVVYGRNVADVKEPNMSLAVPWGSYNVHPGVTLIPVSSIKQLHVKQSSKNKMSKRYHSQHIPCIMQVAYHMFRERINDSVWSYLSGMMEKNIVKSN